MKKTLEVKADPGKQLTFEQLERFVEQARKQGAGQMRTQVRASVRFNGTLRGMSVEIEDAPPVTGGQSVTDSSVGGNVTQVRGVGGDVSVMREDDAWLAQQW